ncbi:MAG: D-alanyl-D-alanine carboxypeptidase family protein [Solirubrobacteraceae bacterium]
MKGRVALAALAAGLAGLAAPAAASAVPAIRAPAAFLLERDTGRVIYSRSPHQRRLIASTTKLMTALVTLERARLGRTVTVAPYVAGPGESTAGLRAGQRVTVRDLLRAMLLASANEAAHALAIDVAGSLGAFVDEMNDQARVLHLRDTHYATPVGLDSPGNYSSAADLGHLADVLLRDRFFAATVDRAGATLPSAGSVQVVNRNDLVGRYPFVIGIKTGRTDAAGDCLVGAGRRRGATMISVVLGEPNAGARDRDTLALLRYGLSMYRRAQLVRRGQAYASVPVAGAPAVMLRAARGASAVLRVGRRATLRVVGLAASVAPPVARGARLGFLDALAGGRVIARVPLVAARAVPLPATTIPPSTPATPTATPQGVA